MLDKAGIKLPRLKGSESFKPLLKAFSYIFDCTDISPSMLCPLQYVAFDEKSLDSPGTDAVQSEDRLHECFYNAWTEIISYTLQTDQLAALSALYFVLLEGTL